MKAATPRREKKDAAFFFSALSDYKEQFRERKKLPERILLSSQQKVMEYHWNTSWGCVGRGWGVWGRGEVSIGKLDQTG